MSLIPGYQSNKPSKPAAGAPSSASKSLASSAVSGGDKVEKKKMSPLPPTSGSSKSPSEKAETAPRSASPAAPAAAASTASEKTEKRKRKLHVADDSAVLESTNGDAEQKAVSSRPAVPVTAPIPTPSDDKENADTHSVGRASKAGSHKKQKVASKDKASKEAASAAMSDDLNSTPISMPADSAAPASNKTARATRKKAQ